MKIYNPTIEGEITLPAFPSTRNDGVIPTNKILSTDASGNLKLYSIATAPAPFLDYVVPDSTLPSTTGNFQLHGSFFTPSMCLTANLATSIIFTGQTVNYAIFHSSNWIEVNITTGATEGSFAVTLNNGLSATFANAILIVLGTVFKPLTAEWTLTEPIDVDDDKVNVQTFNSYGSALWSKQFNYLINFSVRFRFKRTPLGSPTSINEYQAPHLVLENVLDGTDRFIWNIKSESATLTKNEMNVSGAWIQGIDSFNPSIEADYLTFENKIFEFRFVAGIMYYYIDSVLKLTSNQVLSGNLRLNIRLKTFDITDIKYIELA